MANCLPSNATKYETAELTTLWSARDGTDVTKPTKS